jgi:5-methylcytosine-specific restriction endonuclease McrA
MPGKGRPWDRERARFKAECRIRNAPCWCCGQPIDYNAEPRTPDSFTVDHVTPTSLGGDVLRVTNWRPARYGCNSSRGNTTRGQFPTSRTW